MKTDFVLRVTESRLKKAADYASSQGFQLEQLMESYIEFLAVKEEKHSESSEEIHAFMKDLHHEFDHSINPDAKKDYRRYLIEKYR